MGEGRGKGMEGQEEREGGEEKEGKGKKGKRDENPGNGPGDWHQLITHTCVIVNIYLVIVKRYKSDSWTNIVYDWNDYQMRYCSNYLVAAAVFTRGIT